MSFLDLAGDDSDVSTAPPKKKSFLDLAGGETPAPIVRGKVASAPPPDVAAPGAPFSALPPNDQAAVVADMVKRGVRQATFNGRPVIDSDPGAGRGTINPPMASQPQPVPVSVPAPLHGFAAIPREPGAAPVAAPTQAPPGNWWDKPWAAMQAGANTAAGAVGGGTGLVYGALEGAGQNATRALAGQPPIDVEQQALLRARQFTPELPKAIQTPLGQQYTEDVGDAMATHGPSLVAIGPEIGMLGKAIGQQGPTTGVLASRSMKAMQDTFAAQKAAALGERIDPTVGPVATSPAAAPVRQAPVPPTAGAAVTPIALKFDDAPPTPPAGQSVSNAERFRRAQVLSSVGLDQARESSLSGNAKAAATESQMAKVDSPSGNEMRAQLDSEKATLANHADDLIKNTGGSQGLDQSALFGRGNAIVAPLDALKEHFDTQTSALYKAADERAQGVPTQLDAFRKALGDDSEMTNADRVHLRAATNSYAKSLGLIGDDGEVFANGQQAETMRKYLGDNWSPQNGKFVSKLKQALDQDVMSAAGEDIYGQARDLWKQRKDTLDNPNGIAKIMDASGPEGVNRSVPIEKIPDAIAGMPVQQFGHVIDTLKNVPAEVQPQAAAALSEIKAHFANKVQAIGTSQAGQWNAKGVTKFLNNNSERMALVFEPEEIAQFKNLNDAGHIVAKDQSYPGAAVQQHNLIRSGVAAGLQTGGAALGGSLGGPGGAAIGSWLGAKAGTAINDAASLRAARGRLTRLKDVGK